MNIFESIKNLYYRAHYFISQQSVKIRLCVLFSFLLLIFSLWLLLIFIPAHKHVNMKAKFAKVKASLEKVREDTDMITSRITGGASSAEKADLDSQAQAIEKYLSLLDNEIIRPDKMSSVLKDVLLEKHSLVLTNFSVNPKQPLVQGVNLAKPELLYRQDVAFTFTGEYFDTLQYLQHLESLQWQFFWDDMEYNVYKYPKAKVTVNLHTLGKPA